MVLLLASQDYISVINFTLWNPRSSSLSSVSWHCISYTRIRLIRSTHLQTLSHCLYTLWCCFRSSYYSTNPSPSFSSTWLCWHCLHLWHIFNAFLVKILHIIYIQHKASPWFLFACSPGNQVSTQPNAWHKSCVHQLPIELIWDEPGSNPTLGGFVCTTLWHYSFLECMQDKSVAFSQIYCLSHTTNWIFKNSHQASI